MDALLAGIDSLTGGQIRLLALLPILAISLLGYVVISMVVKQYVYSRRYPNVYPKERFPLEHTILLLQNFTTPLETMLNWTLEWPHTTFSFQILGQPRYFSTYDPKNIQHILKDDFDKFGKGPVFRTRAQGLLGNGIFNVDGNPWYIHRKISANLFNVRLFKTTILSTFLEHCDILEHMLKLAPAGATHDMHDLFHRFTLDSIGQVIAK